MGRGVVCCQDGWGREILGVGKGSVDETEALMCGAMSPGGM